MSLSVMTTPCPGVSCEYVAKTPYDAAGMSTERLEEIEYFIHKRAEDLLSYVHNCGLHKVTPQTTVMEKEDI